MPDITVSALGKKITFSYTPELHQELFEQYGIDVYTELVEAAKREFLEEAIREIKRTMVVKVA